MPHKLAAFRILFGCILISLGEPQSNSDNAPSAIPTDKSQHLISEYTLSTTEFPPNPIGLPNAFTTASWNVPALEKYIYIPMPGYEASEIIFNAFDNLLIEKGQANHGVFANLVAQNLIDFEQFSFSYYLYFKGNVLEKFLTQEKFKIDSSLPQKYADCLQKAVNSTVINTFEQLEVALVNGYLDFTTSLGFNSDRIYISTLLFNKEVLDYGKIPIEAYFNQKV